MPWRRRRSGCFMQLAEEIVPEYWATSWRDYGPVGSASARPASVHRKQYRPPFLYQSIYSLRFLCDCPRSCCFAASPVYEDLRVV
jgi:hypothetical protein